VTNSFNYYFICELCTDTHRHLLVQQTEKFFGILISTRLVSACADTVECRDWQRKKKSLRLWMAQN